MSPRLVLSEGLAREILKGHPWIFADVLEGRSLSARTGDFITLERKDGRPLGLALYEHGSPIPLRVITLNPRTRPDEDLWKSRVLRALHLRVQALGLETTESVVRSDDVDDSQGTRVERSTADRTDVFRLIHGEGDDVPGVVVDSYAGFLVMKLDTSAWLPHLRELTRALVDVAKPRGIYLKGVRVREPGKTSGPRKQMQTPSLDWLDDIFGGKRGEDAKSDSPRARAEALSKDSDPSAPGIELWGRPPPVPIEVCEHGMKLRVDVVRGQKTGLFIDQRENRRLMRGVARSLEVLNLFSYTGGFSVACALGGARRVISVDVGKGAVEGARENFAINGFDPRDHEFVVADAFEYLRECSSRNRRFDCVIVDPPSFAPSKRTLAKALSAYAELNELAIQCVKDGGLLATSSCSSHVTMEHFLEALGRARQRTRSQLRLLEMRGQPADHPAPLHFPEGRYLKFVLATVEHNR